MTILFGLSLTPTAVNYPPPIDSRNALTIWWGGAYKLLNQVQETAPWLSVALELIGQANNSEPLGWFTLSPTKAIIFEQLQSASPIQPHLTLEHLKDLLLLNPMCRQQLHVFDV